MSGQLRAQGIRGASSTITQGFEEFGKRERERQSALGSIMGSIQGDPSMMEEINKNPDSDVGKIWSRAQSGRASNAEINQLNGLLSANKFEQKRKADATQAQVQQDFMKSQEAQMRELTAFNLGTRRAQERAEADDDRMKKRAQAYEDLGVRVGGGQATPSETAQFNVLKNDGVTPMIAAARAANVPFKDYVAANSANDARIHQRAIEDITRQTALTTAKTGQQTALNAANKQIAPGTKKTVTPFPGKPPRVIVLGNDNQWYDEISGLPLLTNSEVNPFTGGVISKQQANPALNPPDAKPVEGPDNSSNTPGSGGEPALPSGYFDKSKSPPKVVGNVSRIVSPANPNAPADRTTPAFLDFFSGPQNSNVPAFLDIFSGPPNSNVPANPQAQMTPAQRQKVETLGKMVREGTITEELALRLMAQGN